MNVLYLLLRLLLSLSVSITGLVVIVIKPNPKFINDFYLWILSNKIHQTVIGHLSFIAIFCVCVYIYICYS